MKLNKRAILPLITAAFAALYGALDYAGTVDEWRGRAAAMRVFERMSTAPSGDSVMMFDDEEGFERGVDFIADRSPNPAVRESQRKGERPTVVARFGGIDVPGVGYALPEFARTIKPRASSSSLLAVGFNYWRKDRAHGWGFALCSLGDIPAWVNSSRESERFWVYTGLVGILSLITALLELQKDRRPKKRGTRNTPPG